MREFDKICLVVLLCYVYTAHGKEPSSLGYDADHVSYFFRTYAPDKSLQVGFTAGCSWYAATPVRPDDFRNGRSLTPAMNHFHAGVSSEKNFLNMRLALTVGLYYSQLNTYLLGWPDYKGVVYIVDREDNEMVHYTSVSNVRTVSSYVSIPIEVSCAPVNKPTFGLYLKGSVMANINVHTTASLMLDKQNIPEHSQTWLLSYFKGEESFSLSAAAWAGLRWGEYDSPNFRIEVGLPFMPVNNDVIYLHSAWGVAARMSLYVPLFFFYN